MHPYVSFEKSELILDHYDEAYRYVQLKEEDFIRIYGLTVFVDEQIMSNSLNTFQEICNGKKRKILVDPTLEVGMTNEARNMLKNDVPKMTTSLALMTNNVFTQLTANLFMKLTNDEFNVKLFKNHEKAVNWIKEQ
jgi:hypothetical protein